MRKYCALLLTLALLLSVLPGCSGTGSPASAAPVGTTAPVVTASPTTPPTASPTPSPTPTPAPTPTPTPTPMPKLPGTSGNYLILCETEAQKATVAAFAAYKGNTGYTVWVKSVEADVKPAAKADASAEVLKFLKRMENELKLEYVLLVGDPYLKGRACPQHTGGAIPMRYLYYNSSNHNTRYIFDWYDYRDPDKSAFNTPTDMYYAFDFNWDYDKDGYAGEMDEVRRAVRKAKPKLMYQLGRIPFSDEAGITAVLDASMRFGQTRRGNSNALLAAGILSYPESKEHREVADSAHYADALAGNLAKSKIKTTTMTEKGGLMPSRYACTLPLDAAGFAAEFAKEYDLTYTFGHGGYSMALWRDDANGNKLCDEEPQYYDIMTRSTAGNGGLLYMDGCHTMRVETDTDSAETLHMQDLLRTGACCGGVATTRETGFNPMKPAPRMVSRMFTHKSLCVARELYASAIDAIVKDDVLEAYVYCYLGDPSITLRPCK